MVQYVFLGLHMLWAVPCALVSIWLASAKGGHPPGIVFVPFVVAAWIGGHLTLGLTQWLLSRGLRGGNGLLSSCTPGKTYRPTRRSPRA